MHHLPAAGSAIGRKPIFGHSELIPYVMIGALAEFERDIIRERTSEGLASARTRGRFGGRPCALDSKKAKMARSLYDGKQRNVRVICETLGISKATLYRHLNMTAA